MSQIIPTAEPFFFLGDSSKPACLLVHGFTSSPKEMRLLGEYLYEQGYTCLCMRNTGHGTQPEDMIRSRYTDWKATVEDGYQLLRGVTENIFLVGLSMGGALSLLMSTKLNVFGVVALSTPYQLSEDSRLKYAGLISRFIPFIPKGKDAPGSGWFDKEAWREHVAYPQNPVRSVGELNLLLAEMRGVLGDITAPVLLIHSRDDKYVLPESMEHIYAELVKTSDKTKFYITGSGHVVTRDAARRQVFELTLEFLQRVESKSK